MAIQEGFSDLRICILHGEESHKDGSLRWLYRSSIMVVKNFHYINNTKL